jgi:predicted ester cyclase
MKGRRLVLLSAIVVAILIGGGIIQQLRVESREQPVTAADLRILQRADVLLKDPASWNHDDDRLCDDDEATGKRSLFCALQKAATEELGSYEHRNVALQEVRFAIEDATRDRQNMTFDALRHFRLPHRLMDFNNLPETRFEDIHNVLRAAATRVAARLNAARARDPADSR